MDQENNTSEAFENERHYLGDLLDDEGFISWKLDDCKSNSNFEISEQLSIESENINVTPESVHSDPGYAHSITRDSFASTKYSSKYSSQNFFYSSPISNYHHVHSKNQTLAQTPHLQNGMPNTAHGINNLNQTSPNVLPRPNNLTLQRTFSQAAKKNLPLSPVVSLSNGGRFTPPVQKKMTVVSATSRSKPKQSSAPPPTSNGITTSNGQQKIWGLNPLTKSKKDCVARDADVFKFAKKRNQQSSKPQKSSTSKQVAELKSNGPTKNGKHANVTENGATFGLRKFESKFDVLQKLTDLSTNEERIREVESTNRRSPSLSIRSDSSDGSAEVENGSSTRGSSKRSSRSNGQQSSGTSSPTTTQKTFAPSALATSLLGLYQKPKTKRQKVKRPCSDGIWVIIIALLMNAYTLFSKGLFWVFDLVVDFVYLLFVAAIMLFRKVVSKFT
ncbi:hypothetical protein M3Y96_01142000 [Aphelenchoides besseyi]|nr:hypothetical protein M3Y96_01142000 [Aphelenchoides besseyi]